MSEVPDVLPRDEHNAELAANVHPTEWANPAPADLYDLVVIGAGTAGLVAAGGAAGLGAKVALIEQHLLGGDCLNVGCVPSKCMIRSSRVAADLLRAGDFGVQTQGDVQVDFPAVMERMRRLRARISYHDAAARFRDAGVDVFLGRGSFTGPDAAEVGGVQLRFVRACIATGARAVRPDTPGLAEAGFLTNETVFSLTERPERLAVFGAGPIGCELAQAFRRLGCDVKLIHRGPRLLPREDTDATAILARAFEKDGVDVKLNSTVVSVTASADGKDVRYESDGRRECVTVDEVLVGAGRAPNVEEMGLEEAGVEYDARQGVHVDDRLRTTSARIYAAGDVCMRHKFTHAADAAARIVIGNALFFGRGRLSALTVPWCTYTDPEIAHVGMYENEAEERGIRVQTFVERLVDVDRAIVDGEDEGFVKVHVKDGTDRILGATIVARHAGEMINELTLAMVGGLGLKTVARVIHPYPTQAEGIKCAADAYNRTRLGPFVKWLLGRVLAWRR